MSRYKVKSSALKGELRIPSSKSHTLRAILFATLAHGRSVIHHPLISPDTDAMIAACTLFGAKFTQSNNSIIVEGVGGKIRPTQNIINAGNSGIVLRFCSAVAALGSKPITITGDHSICFQRPMKPLIDGLQQLKVAVTSRDNSQFAPLTIHGPIVPNKVKINGQDSQYVSALLIASAFATGSIEIFVEDPGEKPWVGLTLDWFERLQIPYTNDNFTHYKLQGNATIHGFEYTVPGDFSSAAFPLAAALITNSELTLHNVDMTDPQGDKEVIHVLQKMGAIIEMDDKKRTLQVKKGSSLSGITIDINNFIDAITILAVVGCYAAGETRIVNGAIARHKECNRIQSIVTELKKMGANIQETEDGLVVRKSSLKGSPLLSYNDHRMAMSLAVAAFGAHGETIIQDVDCVKKTYGCFPEHFSALGADIETIG